MAPSRTDEELVSAFVGGDEQAFTVLLQRYERRVYGICLRYFRDPQDAEDAAQIAFMTLYRRAETFSGASKFSTWMYRVATNACNDLARRRSRRPRKADAVVEDMPLADPVDEIAEKDLELDLRQALLQLEPDYRHAVVAHSLHGRPYAEIAEEVGVAVGTIKSRVHRGHAKLAQILTEADRPRTGPQPPARSGGGEPSGRSPPPT